MNTDLLHSIKNHTGTLIQQAKTKQQKTIEFKMNKQMQTLSFNPAVILVEESKWLLALIFLKQRTLFLIYLTKTIRFESLYQVIEEPNMLKKLLTK